MIASGLPAKGRDARPAIGDNAQAIRRLMLQQTGRLKAVHERHIEVQNHDIWPGIGRQSESFRSAIGLIDNPSLYPEHVSKRVGTIDMVVDYQNSEGKRALH